MARSYELSFKLGAQLSGTFKTAFEGATGAVGSLQTRIGKMNTEASKVGDLIKQKNAVALAAREYMQAKQHVAMLGAEIRNVKKPTAAMIAEMQKAHRTVDAASSRLDQQRATLRSLSSDLGMAGKSTKDLTAHQKALESQAKRSSAAQASLQRSMDARDANLAQRGNIRGQIFDAVAIGGMIAAPVKMAMDWEQNLAELNKVADLTPDRLSEIAKAAQDMAIKTGVAREEIIGAYTAAAQGGMAQKDWAQFSDATAKMAVAFDGLSGADAGKMFMAWQAGMGLSVNEAENLASAVNHLGNSVANANATDIGEVLQRQGGVLKAAGIGGVDAAALSAAMLSGGASPEIAATAAKNFAKALSKGDAVTGNERKALEALGFGDPKALAMQMQEAPREAIISVLESMRGLAEEEQLGVMTRLFGSESIGAIAPLIGNLDNLKQAFALVGDETKYATSLQDEFDAMGNTSRQNMLKFKEATKVLSTTVGEMLVPEITKLVKEMTPLVGTIVDFIDENRTLVGGAIKVIAALGAVKIATLAAGYAWTYAKGAWIAGSVAIKTVRVWLNSATAATIRNSAATAANTVAGWANAAATKAVAAANAIRNASLAVAAWVANTAATVANTAAAVANSIGTKLVAAGQWIMTTATYAATAAQWAFNAAFYATPIGWIVLGIGAIIAAGVLLYKNWDKITAWWGETWTKIKTIAGDAWDSLKAWFTSFSLFDSGKAIFQTLIDGIKSMGGALVDTVSGAFGKVRDMLPFSDAKTGPFSELTASGSAIIDTLGDGVRKAGSSPLLQPFSDAVGGVRGAIDALSGGSSVGAGSGDGDGGAITLNVTQNIAINGAGADVAAEAKAGAEAGVEGMIAAIQKAMKREERLSYG